MMSAGCAAQVVDQPSIVGEVVYGRQALGCMVLDLEQVMQIGPRWSTTAGEGIQR